MNSKEDKTELHPLIAKHRAAIEQICQTNRVSKLYLFGSIVKKAQFNESSDIDLLVSFDEESISMEEYVDNYFSLSFELEDLLKRKIDLITERSVKNPLFKKELEKTRVLVYSEPSVLTNG